MPNIRQASKDEVVGVLLALFLGGLGVHKFYLGETGLGILYLVFFWTGIPAIIGFIECFLMPGRVRSYNAQRAQTIMAGILASAGQPGAGYAVVPQSYAAVAPQYAGAATTRVCPGCQSAVQPDAGFCARCGAAA